MINPVCRSIWPLSSNLPKTKAKKGVQIKFISNAGRANRKFLKDLVISRISTLKKTIKRSIIKKGSMKAAEYAVARTLFLPSTIPRTAERIINRGCSLEKMFILIRLKKTPT
jgi:hypothetical protein